MHSKKEILESEKEILKLLPQRFNLSHARPDFLAPIYRYLKIAPGYLQNLGDTLSNLLIDLTVNQAIDQTSYYKESFSFLGKNQFVGSEELKDLPILDRKDIQDADFTIRSSFSEYSFSSYTTGTTTGIPLIIDRSNQEQLYLGQFFSQLSKGEPESLPKLVLSLELAVNGSKLQLPGSVFTFPVTPNTTDRLKQAAHLLSRSFQVNNEPQYISTITGSPLHLFILTTYLKAENLDFLTERIELIQSFGMYLTRSKQDWLSHYWQAPVSDIFSFTELFMRASRCFDCGLHHFDHFGLVEVVEKSGNNRISIGRGRLIVTGFFPFTQMTPLIRYEVGDLVEKIKTECRGGVYGYKFLGRIKNSLDLEDLIGPNSFLGTGELYEILDGIPDIRNRQGPNDSRLPTSCYNVAGIPFFWFDRTDDNIVTINIELRYSPVMFERRCIQLRKMINERLLNAFPFLDKLLTSNKLRVDFFPPGYYLEKFGKKGGDKFALL